MNKTKQIIITGHSHSFCLGVPVAKENDHEIHIKKISDENEDLENNKVEFFATIAPWDGARSKHYWEYTANHAAEKAIGIFWAGNQYNSDFLFLSENPFDFYISGSPEQSVQENFDIIPKLVVKNHLMRSISGLTDTIKLLKKNSPVILVIGTPPPKYDNQFLLSMILKSEYFTENAKKFGINEITANSITPISIRQKLWLLTQEIMEEVAIKNGAKFIPVPSHLIETNGCLKREYWANDVTHANQNYGKQLKKHIANVLIEVN